MRSAFLLWSNTRMIVLVAVCAAIYAATLIAFKTAVPIIPGITEVRVAGVFPIVFGFLFGPAGAWGLAFGNLIGDIFGGTLSPASIAGFFGNFLLGYLPYTMWTTLNPFAEKSYEWNIKHWRSWTSYLLLDYRHQRDAMEMLKRLNGLGHTIIVITHAIWIAESYADRTIVMKDGRILADGPTRAVFRDEMRLQEASLAPSPLVRLSNRLGMEALTLEEMIEELRS